MMYVAISAGSQNYYEEVVSNGCSAVTQLPDDLVSHIANAASHRFGLSDRKPIRKALRYKARPIKWTRNHKQFVCLLTFISY